ncbi:hypothetical protein BC831DRAFT_481795 [Entophlyctis helioformis]|nr:hypothetical protein BC831DRAFT_481795 [Entophlyctis helioformis]
MPADSLNVKQPLPAGFGPSAPLSPAPASQCPAPLARVAQSLAPSRTRSTKPVSETIMRDLNNIWTKIKQADKNILRDWDWWGPLLLCLGLSVRLSITAQYEQGPAVFSATFFIIWFGSAVVTLNSKLLGGRISLFQSVCVLGYCVFPLVAVSLVTWILPFLLKFVLVAVAFAWSTFASLNFLGDVNLENKRLLAIYPIFLFYMMIAWLILIAT